MDGEGKAAVPGRRSFMAFFVIRRRFLFLLLVFLLPMVIFGSLVAWGLPRDRFYWERAGAAVWEVPVQEPVIALTFDDGPDPVFTPQVLALLAEFKAYATFFEVGKEVEAYPEVARQVAAAGHEIGNHTYSHRSVARVKAETLRQELDRAGRAIAAATGRQPRLFRPPGGYYDDTVITTARQMGYQVVLWSWGQDTRDWANPGAGNIVRHVLANARPGNIVILHDGGGNRSQTVQALYPMLRELQKRGFRFVTVSELLQYGHRHASDLSPGPPVPTSRGGKPSPSGGASTKQGLPLGATREDLFNRSVFLTWGP